MEHVAAKAMVVDCACNLVNAATPEIAVAECQNLLHAVSGLMTEWTSGSVRVRLTLVEGGEEAGREFGANPEVRH